MLLINKQLNGYITLLSVLIVGAISISITTSIILLGLSSADTGFSYQQMHQAKSLANACAEEALENIRETTSFAGSGSLTQGQGSCTYAVTNTGGSSRQIDTVGTVGTVVRKSAVTISAIVPLIIISSWQEI
jgi:hypothetical protein